MTISTLMSGYSRRSFASFGSRIASAAYSVAVIRMVPAGFSRSSHTASSSASISSKRGVVEQAFARLRRRDAARGPCQQPNAEPRFEFANGMAERRLRDAELRCRIGETAFPRHGHEGQQVVEVAALH